LDSFFTANTEKLRFYEEKKKLEVIELGFKDFGSLL
jgi:hypothetical protein